MEHLGLTEWVAIISGLLLTVSEILPFTVKVRSNGIFQAIIAILGFTKKK